MDKILKKTQADYNTISQHFSEKRRYIWQEIKPFLKYVRPGKKVLDLGCGNARLYKELKGKKINYLGIDFSQELLKIAQKENPRAHFKYGDITEVKTWKNLNNFDVCCSIAVFHNLYKRDLQLKVLEQIKRALKPGGILIITVWNLWQKSFWPLHLKQLRWKTKNGFKLKWLLVPYRMADKRGKLIKKVNRFCYAFTPWELEKIIKESGFKIIEKKLGRNLCFSCKKQV